MPTRTASEVYSPREIALASGVSEAQVLAVLGPTLGGGYLSHADAVRVGRQLASRLATSVPDQMATSVPAAPEAMFSVFGATAKPHRSAVPLALSSTVHAGIFAFIVFLTTFNLTPRAAALKIDERPADPMRLVFVATPGPGGGGGGGGLMQKAPPPKALRQGHHTISSPLPVRQEPKPIEPVPLPPEPKPAPPLKAEQLPTIVAPIITAPADNRDRIGVLQQTPAETESHGSGKGGGAGTGTGTGLGEGDGSGVGPGSGGGTGGGPYRPGSGIEAPRLLKEVRADYTEEARQRGLAGDVVLEIIVRRDGSVGDVKILQGMGAGLNDRAIQAVKQWKFAPARRLGTPVDVIVEVAVEFKLR
jgi:TonB family protein